MDGTALKSNDPTSGGGDVTPKETAERYRRAAEETLDQLDWCVDYLYRLRKPGIAQAVGKNRSAIRRHMSRTTD